MGLFAGTKWDLPSHCDRCGQLETDCCCPPESPPTKPPEEQTLRVNLEKRKRGKVVTVIKGLEESEPKCRELLTQLKQACGAGGTREDTVLVIQGDQRAQIAQRLQELGYRVR